MKKDFLFKSFQKKRLKGDKTVNSDFIEVRTALNKMKTSNRASGQENRW